MGRRWGGGWSVCVWGRLSYPGWSSLCLQREGPRQCSDATCRHFAALHRS